MPIRSSGTFGRTAEHRKYGEPGGTRTHALADLLRPLTQEQLRDIKATAPRSNQEFWDEAVRRWPALTAEIVAGAKPDAPSFD